MPLPLLAIASGAAKVAGKLFRGIKIRRAAKKEKRATKQSLKDLKFAEAEAKLRENIGSLGASPITQSGNALMLTQAAKGQILGSNDELESSFANERTISGGEGFLKTPFGMVIIGVIGFVLLKALKVIK